MDYIIGYKPTFITSDGCGLYPLKQYITTNMYRFSSYGMDIKCIPTNRVYYPYIGCVDVTYHIHVIPLLVSTKIIRYT